MDENFSHMTNHAIAAGGAGWLIAFIVGWLTPLVALVGAFAAVCWYSIQIYESKTFQGFLTKRRLRIAARLRNRLAKFEKQD